MGGGGGEVQLFPGGGGVKIYIETHRTCDFPHTGGCYNELVVAFFSTGGGVKGKKSIPVDFLIYL